MTAAPDAVRDPFRWLEDPDLPASRKWLRRQRQLTDAELGQITSRAWIRNALTAASHSPPQIRHCGDWSLRLIRDAGRPGGIIVARRGDGRWRTVADAALAYPAGGAVITRWDPSPTGVCLAVQFILNGDETTTPIQLIFTATGEQAGAALSEVRHSHVDWIDDDTLLYVGRDGLRRRRVSEGESEVVFAAPAPAMRIRHRLWHGRWVTVSVRDGAAIHNTLWLIDVSAATPPWRARPIQDRPDAETSALVCRDGRLILLTSLDADRRRIMTLDTATPDRAHWRVLVPEGAAVIRAAAVMGAPPREELVVVRSSDNICEVAIHDSRTGAHLYTAPLPRAGTVAALDPDREGTGCTLTYTDWVTPPTRYALSTSTRSLRQLDARPQATGVHTEQLRYPSTDGTAVPLTLLTPVGQDGPRPTLLTVYGGFGVPIRPSYQPDALTWVRAGGALAIAQVRGSGGLGRRWHRDGCLDRKRQAIDDLHAAADWLVRAGRAHYHQLALLGGSNGGLLVTAAIVASPHRYAAGAAIAPLTDMARYERSGLGSAWTAEYGTAKDPEQLRWLLGYSPYHNVREGRSYPPMLLVSGANDSRVDPMHARKLCAMLQYADPNGGPTLLYMVGGAGHGTNSISQELDMATAILSFLAAHVGLPIPS